MAGRAVHLAQTTVTFEYFLFSELPTVVTPILGTRFATITGILEESGRGKYHDDSTWENEAAAVERLLIEIGQKTKWTYFDDCEEDEEDGPHEPRSNFKWDDVFVLEEHPKDGIVTPRQRHYARWHLITAKLVQFAPDPEEDLF
jgi:hypothetical protein